MAHPLRTPPAGRFLLYTRDGWNVITRKKAHKLRLAGLVVETADRVLHEIEKQPTASSRPENFRTGYSPSIDVIPAPPWQPGHLTEWGGALPVQPEWLQRMGYALEFGT